MFKSLNVLANADSTIKAAFVPDCGNDDGKKEAAVLHTITDLMFLQFIKYQYGGAPPVETVLSRDEVIEKINAALAGSVLPNHLELSWHTTTHHITVTPKTGEPAKGPNDVDYSVCLFKGILLLDDTVDEFRFYKAKNKNDEDTIVFKTMQGSDVLHYYDVSNDIP